MTIQTCGNCRFWFLAGETGKADMSHSKMGVCRRRPPAIHFRPLSAEAQGKDESLRVTSAFPPMQSTGWCGEHSSTDLGEIN